MRRTVLLLLAIAIVWIGARRAYRAWVGEEPYVRAAIEDAARGFDEGSLRRVVRVLGPRYRDATTGVDRDLLSAGLLQLLREGRAADGRFLWDLDLPPEELLVVLDAQSAERADARLRLILREGAAEPRETVWEAAVELRLERLDGDWKVVLSRHRTLSGRRPGR